MSLSQWDYHRPDAQDILAAAVLAERYRISFWDALIVHSAEALGASLLWSEDLNPGQRFGALEVHNPFQEIRAPAGGLTASPPRPPSDPR